MPDRVPGPCILFTDLAGLAAVAEQDDHYRT
jgi:hypothetical protein